MEFSFIWILRFNIAAYCMGRRISINGFLSKVVIACRSITAGSTFATTELRLLLLIALDFVAAAFPALPLMVYVDDTFLAAVGIPQYVCRKLPAAVRLLARELRAMDLEISLTKSEGIASTPDLSRRLVESLVDLGMQFSSSRKSLGADLSATLR